MKKIERNDVIELAARTQCSVCKMPYGREGVRVLGRRSEAWVIAVNCPHCDAEGLLIATVEDRSETGVVNMEQQTERTPPIMYDVTFDEWLAFQEKEPVGQDDVLDIHVFLKDFDGDFAKLFAEKVTDRDS